MSFGSDILKRIISLAICLALLCFQLSFGTSALSITAGGAALISAQTGDLLFGRNEHTPLPMASTTKIMTAIILAEQQDINTKVTVTSQMITVEGTSMGLKAGDTVTYLDLIYGLMLPSGNDAANTAAIAIAGSIEKFAELMNSKANALGLSNAYFITPSGLDANGHSISAHDLALLASYALKNQYIKKAVSTKYFTVKTEQGRELPLSNHNKLLKIYDGAVGVKTGYTLAAGRCLVSAAERNGVLLIAVTLNDRNDWNDHIAMLDYGFSICSAKSLSVEVKQLPLVLGGDSDLSLVEPDFNVQACQEDNARYTVLIPQMIFAPIKSGEIVGRADFYFNNTLIGSIPIKALNDVDTNNSEINFISKMYNIFKTMLGS